MAIINMEGIINNGNMVAAAKENARNLRTENVLRRIDRIRNLRNKCIDAMDTILFLSLNGLGEKFDDWQKGRNIRFVYQNRSFLVGRREEGTVEYRPYSNSVELDWCNHGMMEHYSTVKTTIHCLVERVGINTRFYNKNLTTLANELEPYVDSFIEWVKSLK